TRVDAQIPAADGQARLPFVHRQAHAAYRRRTLGPSRALDLIVERGVVDVRIGDLLEIDVLPLDLSQVVDRGGAQLPQLLSRGLVDRNLVDLGVTPARGNLAGHPHLLIGDRAQLDRDLRRALLARLSGDELDLVAVI